MKCLPFAAAALCLFAVAVRAANDTQAPIVQNVPNLPGAFAGADACGIGWRRIHSTASSLTCEFKPGTPACANFKAGPPLNDGTGRQRCHSSVPPDIPSGPQRQRCGEGWRQTPKSATFGPSGWDWICEPDASHITCPSQWAGPMVNGNPSGRAAISMVCMLPPR